MKTVVALLLMNIVGFFYGMMYYQGQLSATPILFWLFVIDCPFYTLLLALIFLASVFELRSKEVNFLVSAGAIKYGIWTLSVLLYFGNYFFAPELFMESSILFILHIGLILEAFLLIGKNNVGMLLLLIAFGWYFLNDWIDYELGMHPYLPAVNEFLIAFTVGLSIFSVLLVYVSNYLKINPYFWNKFLYKLRDEIL